MASKLNGALREHSRRCGRGAGQRLAIGGFARGALEAHRNVAHTYACFTEELIVAGEPGAPVPEELEGETVYAAPDLLAVRLIDDKDGIPIHQTSQHVAVAPRT